MSDFDMTAADALRKAKTVLTVRGWAQGDYEDDAGHVCAAGAIGVAVAGIPGFEELPPEYDEEIADFYERSTLYRRACRYLAELLPDANIARFNDEQESVAPILDALSRAAVFAENEPERRFTDEVPA